MMIHPALKPPIVHISRPNSAAANNVDVRAVPPSAPAQPANAPGSRTGRPASCSPVARRRDLVPQRLIQSPRARGTSLVVQAAAAASAAPSSEQNRNQSGRIEESNHVPLGSDQEGESASVFAATLARKEAEEAVQQLARRIAHYRIQEERVLREVWGAKRTLEAALAASDPSSDVLRQATMSSNRSSRTELAGIAHPTGDHRHQLPASHVRERVRVRDHLQFLSKQKRILHKRKQDAARRQKEKMQSALAQQKQRLEAEVELRKAQKERIRSDKLQSVADRAAKQRRAAELQETRRGERLAVERERELHARSLVEEMLDEERNLALRLEALRLHQSPLVPPRSSPSKR